MCESVYIKHCTFKSHEFHSSGQIFMPKWLDYKYFLAGVIFICIIIFSNKI